MKNNAKSYWQLFRMCLVTLIMVTGLFTQVNAATSSARMAGKLAIANNGKLLILAAVDLPQILPYIMGPNDVFQGYENVVYRNRNALKLRIFNQQSGRVRYVYVDAQSGQIL